MTTVIILIFVIGYLAIALEHPIRINKAASAMLTGVLCWTLCAVNVDQLLPENSVPHWFEEFYNGHDTESDTQQHDDPATTNHDQAVDAATLAPSSPPTANATAANTSSTPAVSTGGQAATNPKAILAKVDLSKKDVEESINLHYLIDGLLGHHLYEIASILFFLMGAMTIVELVDANEGFSIVTDRIRAKSKVKLLWIVGWITFFLSAVLDNLTTTIVMISLLRKLVHDRPSRALYAGIVIIAANAGGAWSVIGDVTTTMLWVKHKITTLGVMQQLFLPSVVCLLAPLLLISRSLKGDLHQIESSEKHHESKGLSVFHRWLFLLLGLAGLLFVPIFKAVTHLPPFMGMILVLSVLWVVSEITAHTIDEGSRSSTGVLHVLRNIDMSSILFFLGILLAVSALGSIGLLGSLATWLDETIPFPWLVATIIGLLSAIVDNVPLVAAGIEMYGNQYSTDALFWMMLAFCAGTGGSCLIIGSAAGVAAMGLEHLEFVWYLRKIGPLALLGYFSGVIVYLLQVSLWSLFS